MASQNNLQTKDLQELLGQANQFLKAVEAIMTLHKQGANHPFIWTSLLIAFKSTYESLLSDYKTVAELVTLSATPFVSNILSTTATTGASTSSVRKPPLPPKKVTFSQDKPSSLRPSSAVKFKDPKKILKKVASGKSAQDKKINELLKKQKEKLKNLKCKLKVKKDVITRCNDCIACRKPDCLKCEYCLDMPKYGGKGTKRKPCKNQSPCVNFMYLLSDGNKSQMKFFRFDTLQGTGNRRKDASGNSAQVKKLDEQIRKQREMIEALKKKMSEEKDVITTCNDCINCRKPDCLRCENCLDMPKYGGNGTKRKPCIDRLPCINFISHLAGGSKVKTIQGGGRDINFRGFSGADRKLDKVWTNLGQCLTVENNGGGCFNTTTGLFTIPVDADYKLSITGKVKGAGEIGLFIFNVNPASGVREKTIFGDNLKENHGRKTKSSIQFLQKGDPLLFMGRTWDGTPILELIRFECHIECSRATSSQ